jgi:hypothetical protein
MSDYALSLSLKICGVGLYLVLASQAALAAHSVSVAKAEPISKDVNLTLTAEVLETAADDTRIPSSGRSYHLSIQLPSGVAPDLSLGSSVNVSLPTIHHNNAVAITKSISKTRVELLLTNQTQLLGGQRLSVVLPLKPAHLYRIPFQAVYSPRGVTTEVFALSSEMRVRLIPIVPLQVLPDGKIIISSDQLDGVSIVVQGTNNLVSGDSVQPIDSKEARL